MSTSPKTIICDIDGTLIKHFGDFLLNIKNTPLLLNNTIESIKKWEKLNYKIILLTGRKESTRKITEDQLLDLGIIYDKLIMGVTNGDRILINDKKPNGINNTAYAINVVRNKGLENIDIINPIVLNKNRIDKPWGYEELVEHNSSYVVKKLFMKKNHACSIQYHELKIETIVILRGSLYIYTGTSIENLEKKEYNMGDSITIYPYTIHRMEGIEDCLYLETSTNELWDVIRIQDNYGRV